MDFNSIIQLHLVAMDTCCGRRLSYSNSLVGSRGTGMGHENQVFIIQRGRDFGWAQQRRWGHSSQVVKAGPVEGACGVRRWCCCKQSLALKRPIKGSRCVLADDQPCCEGFWWQVICRHPRELAVEIEFCIE